MLRMSQRDFSGKEDGANQFMRKSFKLLIADPEDEYLDSLGEYLTKNGFTVIKAKAGKQAFQFALKMNPDLCILDSQLEDVNGFAVCRSIRKRCPELPVFVCSGVYKGPENLKKAKEKFLATDLIEKPFSELDLLHRITEILQESAQNPAATPRISPSLEEKLEQTLSGLELTGMTPKKKKKPVSSSATIQVNTEELKKELNKLRTGKPVSQVYREKPQFKVGSTGAGQASQSKLSSKDIFGDLISDIEKGAKKSKPKIMEEAIEDSVSGPIAPLVMPPLPPEIQAETVYEEPIIDALPGFGQSEASVSPAPDSKANDYELLEKIAAGGMAEVWKARLKGEKGFEKIVAIKKILPHLSDNEEFITMFIDEAKVAANLTHPNIAQIYELGKFGDTFFIAMEYVSGKNLRNILNYCKALNVMLPPSIVAFIGVKLCNALDYAHRKKDHSKNQPLNIVHRDISPQNILVSMDGEIKLVDFGIAKATIKAANTVAGSLKGKLLYMSPEQAEGKNIDHRSDIFSLGNLLYECLTGSRLVDGDSELSILKKVREADFIPPRQINPNIPARLEHILLKSLQKDVENRYSTARELERELKTFMKIEKMHITESDVAEFLIHVDQKDTKKISEFDLTRSQAHREVILPDHLEVRKFERETLGGIRPAIGSTKKWMLAAIGIPVVLGIAYLVYLFVANWDSWHFDKEPEQGSSEMQTPLDPGSSDNEGTPGEQSALPTVEDGAVPSDVESVQSTSETTDPAATQPQDVQVDGSVTLPAVEKKENSTATDSLTEELNKKSEITSTQETVSPGEGSGTGDEASVEEMLEIVKKLKQAKEEKERKLKEYRKANELPAEKTGKNDPKKEGGQNGE